MLTISLSVEAIVGPWSGQAVEEALVDLFVMTDMGKVSLILGMNVTKNYGEGTLTITQKYYVHNILERYGTLDCNSVHKYNLNRPRNS